MSRVYRRKLFGRPAQYEKEIRLSLKRKTREFIRRAIIKTNPCWPFSYLNRLPYKLAIKWFVYNFKHFPQIKDIYTRESMARGDYIPGVSDIDLTVVIKSGLNLQEEFSLLNLFWKRYYKIRKIFPMLTHIDFLNDKYLQTWLKSATGRYELDCRKLIYSKNIGENISATPKTQSDFICSTEHALGFYLYMFLGWYIKNKAGFPVLRRLALKILKCAMYFQGYNGQEKLERFNRLKTKEDLLSFILGCFDESIRKIKLPYTENKVTRKESALQREGVESIISSDEPPSLLFIVLKDSLDISATKDLIDTFAEKRNFSFIMTPSVFKYVILRHEPYFYLRLMTNRSILYGIDLLSDIEAPPKDIFIEQILLSSINLARWSLSIITVFYWDYKDYLAIAKRCIQKELQTFILSKLYLEKGIIISGDGILKECQRHYPQLYQKITEWEENLAYTKEGILNQKSFNALRSAADYVYNQGLNFL